MKKASQIVLLVGAILSIVAAVAWFILSISFLVIGSLVASIASGAIPSSEIPESVKNLIDQIQAAYPNLNTTALVAGWLITYGVIFLITFIFAIPAAVISFLARKKESKVLYILCIIFGFLGSTIVSSVGGILGLIHLAVDNRPSQEIE